MYSIAINVLGKGACITKMVSISNYSTNTIMEKKTNRAWVGGGLRIWNFLGTEVASGFSRG